MVTLNDTAVGVAVQAPPIVAQLRGVFDSLDDEPLLQALIGPMRRGPKGHPVEVLRHCLVAKYVMGLESTAALIRTLQNNPFIAEACGIPSPNCIPHEATFSRFFARLSKYQIAAKLKDVSRRLVRQHYQTIPGFGQRVALDSTTLRGWVNGGKPNPSDKEAGWSVKKNTHGKTEFTLGWKLHLLVDCESELPIAANVSPGNAHDASRASNVLSEARFTTSKFRPKYAMADKGYSGKPLYNLIKRQYRAQPIIDPNASHKRYAADVAEMRQTAGWQALYRQRSSVERVNSRLKGQRSLNHITVRGIRKVTAHCYLSLIAMQVVK
ncbi:MAG: transposase [Chloroflexota bacterium]